MANETYFKLPDPEYFYEDFTQEQVTEFETRAKTLSEKYSQLTEKKIHGLINVIAEKLRIARSREHITKFSEDKEIELTNIQNFLKALNPENENLVEIVLRAPKGDTSKDILITSNIDVINKILDLLREFKYPQKQKRPQGRRQGKKRETIETEKIIGHLFHEYRSYFKNHTKCYSFIADLLTASGYPKKKENIKKRLQLYIRS